MNFKTQVEDYKEMKLDSQFPYAIEEWEAKAKEKISIEKYDYIAAGAGSEDTINENLDAFKRLRIVPRMFRDVRSTDTSVSILGETFKSPVFIAPVGVQKIAHPDGDLATARAAKSVNVPFIASTVSAYSMEEIAEELGDTTRWFQLYWSNNKELVKSLIQRAENSGYSAIVITLDTAMVGWRERDLQHRWLPFLEGVGIANYTSDPVFRSLLDKNPDEDIHAAGLKFRDVFGNTGITWRDLEFIREITTLPILLKGILDPRDAELALHHGVDGIVVSNHGGRQVNGSIATIDALPNVCEVVQGKVPVLMDSGIRRGDDVIKAIAQGASAVLVGRPFIYGLAAGGEHGVRQVLRNLLADFELSMSMSGLKSVSEIDSSILFKR